MARSASKTKTVKKKGSKKIPQKPDSKKKGPKRSSKAKGKPRAKAAAPVVQRPSSFKGLGLKEVAAVVFSKLLEEGHEPVLTGQGCAVIYGGTSIRARQIEFAIDDYAVDSVCALMESLGFRAKEAHTFSNAVCQFDVLLSPKPLTVGDDAVSDMRVIKTTCGPLRMLTPTDCVRQRLSMFYRWGDRNALAEAIHVARRQAIDMDFVRRWSEWEWATDRFDEFVRAVQAAR